MNPTAFCFFGEPRSFVFYTVQGTLCVRNPNIIGIENPVIRLCISEDNIVLTREMSLSCRHVCVMPDNLVPKLLTPEDGIAESFEVMAGSWIAVQIETACLLQHASYLNDSGCHESQVRTQFCILTPRRGIKRHIKTLQESFGGDIAIFLICRPFGDITAGGDCDIIILPRILESRLLGIRAQEDIVIPPAVERRIRATKRDKIIGKRP